MNEKLTRRSVFATLGAAIAGVGSALLFRKLRKPEASVPHTPRVETLDEQIGKYLDTHPGTDEALELVPKPATGTSDVLARSSREDDEKVLFDEDGFWKEEIADRWGPFNMEDKPWGYTKGELTDEEYAAYQRWLNQDYPVVSGEAFTTLEADTDSSESGGRTEERIAA